MFESSLKPSQLCRINQDLLDRSLPGVTAYVFLWPVLIWTTGIMEEWPRLSLWTSVSFWIISILRLLYHYKTKSFMLKHPKVWQLIFAAMSTASPMLWGVLFALCFINPSFRELITPMAVVTAGLTSATMTSLAPIKYFCCIYAVIIISPAVISSYHSNAYHGLSILFTLFLLYVSIMSIRFSKEYLNHFFIEEKLNEQQKVLEKINKIDPLTQIYNRRQFDEYIQDEWKRATRIPSTISLLFIDIDYFKDINDTYGHQFGDECLRKIAAILDAEVKRETDLVARYGGEEFVIVLPITELDAALTIAERVRHKIENASFVLENGNKTIKVTTSVGVSCEIPNKHTNYNKLVEQADKALYQAKIMGKNCVVPFQQDQQGQRKSTQDQYNIV